MTPKQIRLKLGLTQQQMALACNTTLSTWQNWEYEKRQPSGQAQRLLDLLLDFADAGQFETYKQKYMGE